MEAARQASDAECDFAILEQAAEWFAVLSGDDFTEHDRQQWQKWLAASPQHALAWQRVEMISHHFQRIPAGQRHDAGQVLRTHSQTRRHALKLMALCCGVCMVGWGTSTHMPWKQWYAAYKTNVGEIRDFRLAEGSHLWLNTDTSLDIQSESGRLHLSLYKGEALIEPASKSRVPLIIDTAYGALLASNTQFSVFDRDGFGELAVFRGSVQVAPSAAATFTIQAGQQVLFSRDKVFEARSVEPRRKAWINGMLVADDMRLGDFIRELGRYCRGHLACDPNVADLRIVGAYPISDTDRVLSALEQSLPVSINRPLPWWTSITTRAAV
jgi:transmembrane sensor